MKWEDYGESSLTLLAVHCGIDKAKPSIPYDSSDFKRCMHLFECLKMDKWDSFVLLRKTERKYKMWEPFVKEWYKLVELYNEEKDKDSAPKLYEALLTIRKGANTNSNEKTEEKK